MMIDYSKYYIIVIISAIYIVGLIAFSIIFEYFLKGVFDIKKNKDSVIIYFSKYYILYNYFKFIMFSILTLIFLAYYFISNYNEIILIFFSGFAISFLFELRRFSRNLSSYNYIPCCSIILYKKKIIINDNFEIDIEIENSVRIYFYSNMTGQSNFYDVFINSGSMELKLFDRPLPYYQYEEFRSILLSFFVDHNIKVETKRIPEI